MLHLYVGVSLMWCCECLVAKFALDWHVVVPEAMLLQLRIAFEWSNVTQRALDQLLMCLLRVLS